MSYSIVILYFRKSRFNATGKFISTELEGFRHDYYDYYEYNEDNYL